MALHFLCRCLENSPAASVLTFALLVLDYIFVSPSIHGSYFWAGSPSFFTGFSVIFPKALRFGYR